MSYVEYLRSLASWRFLCNPEQDRKIVKSRPTINEIFNDNAIDNPLYIRQSIINHIVEEFHLSVRFEFILGNWNNSNALSIIRRGGTPSILFLDEVLEITLMDLFLTVWSAVYTPEYIDKYKKQTKYLIINKLVKRKNAYDEIMNIIEETQMPDRAVVQACDMYWTAWTFVVSHELFHIMNQEKLTAREEEFKADRFGFQVLIKLIEEQKAGIIPEGLDFFYEEYYLVPCMLMYIFRSMDKHRTDNVEYGSDGRHPTPEERMQGIIDLFDLGDIPDDMDTSGGNAFLSVFLDQFDELMREG